jgi:phytanoyl-CoA hydroxylase
VVTMYDDVTEGMRSDFARDGYVVVDDIFATAALADLENSLRGTIRAFARKAGVTFDGDELDAGLLALEAADHKWVAYVFDTMGQSPTLRRFHDEPRLCRLANALLGYEPDGPLYTFSTRLRIDPPLEDKRTYRWHQEVFYTIPRSEFIQVWAPMVRSSTRANGTVVVCPGSHREGVARCEWIEQPGRATQITVAPEIVAKYEARPMPLEPGQALLFSSTLCHRSGSNTSQHVRYTLVGMYHAVGGAQFVPVQPKFEYAGETPRIYHSEWSKQWSR